MTALSAAKDAIGALASDAPPAPVAAVITYGQFGDALAKLQGVPLFADLGAAWAANFTDVAADATFGEDALDLIAEFWPPAATVEDIIEALVLLVPLIPRSTAPPLNDNLGSPDRPVGR